MLRKLFATAATALILACTPVTASAGYTSIAVFGDSLADGGNDYLLTGNQFPSFPYAQRFTNGPTAVERLASNLGLTLTPSLVGGNNYAYGGAETGFGNYLGVSPDVPPPINAAFGGNNTGVLAQVRSFPGALPGGLAVLWAGPNDLFTALQTNLANFLLDPVGTVIAPAMTNLGTAVAMLYGGGARSILMPGLPNMGATPFGLASADPSGLTSFSAGFNQALHQTVTGLEGLLPGLDIIEFDTFSMLDSIVANPATYGFNNVTAPCFDGVSVCADPGQHLFWDSVHPTARADQILGDAFTVALPEPSVIALVALGLIGVSVARRRSPYGQA